MWKGEEQPQAPRSQAWHISLLRWHSLSPCPASHLEQPRVVHASWRKTEPRGKWKDGHDHLPVLGQDLQDRCSSLQGFCDLASAEHSAGGAAGELPHVCGEQRSQPGWGEQPSPPAAPLLHPRGTSCCCRQPHRGRHAETRGKSLIFLPTSLFQSNQNSIKFRLKVLINQKIHTCQQRKHLHPHIVTQQHLQNLSSPCCTWASSYKPHEHRRAFAQMVLGWAHSRAVC